MRPESYLVHPERVGRRPTTYRGHDFDRVRATPQLLVEDTRIFQNCRRHIFPAMNLDLWSLSTVNLSALDYLHDPWRVSARVATKMKRCRKMINAAPPRRLQESRPIAGADEGLIRTAHLPVLLAWRDGRTAAWFRCNPEAGEHAKARYGLRLLAITTNQRSVSSSYKTVFGIVASTSPGRLTVANTTIWGEAMLFRHMRPGMTSQVCLSFWSGVCVLTLAIPAHSQEAAESPGGLEEIVVTAQRRSESLQNVPIQVAAFGAAAIEAAGIRTTRDFVALIPNVALDESYTYLNSQITVRGVSQLNTSDLPVAVVVDDVPQNSQKQLRMNLFDIERIEVLKGPQGGLYGRNAIGGAINIITKAPSDHLEGFVQSTYSTGDAIDLVGGVSTPLGEDVSLRVAGSYKSDDGRIENVFRGDNVDFVNHDWEVRSKLSADLSESFKLDLRASYRDFDGYGPLNSIVTSGLANDYQPPRTNLEGITFGHIFDASGKIDVKLSGATLISITGYTDLSEFTRGDGDMSNPVDKPGGFLDLGFAAGQAVNLRTTLVSQEVRLVSDSEGPFRWILGSYFLHTDRPADLIGFLDVDGAYDHVNDPLFQFFSSHESNKNDAYAGYANVDYDVGDHLILSGAFRYDHDKRRQTNLVTREVREASFDSAQPKATITYKVTPQQLIYATYSKGFRSGGFNSPIASIPVFDAETLQNYEVGFKTSWFNNKLIVNGAAYHADDENTQYFFIDPFAGGIIGNIDEVRIRGVELDVQALVAPGLQVFGSLGTTDTEILRNSIDPSLTGNKTPQSIPWSANLGFQFDTRLTDEIGLMARVDYQHRSKRYWEADNLHVQEPVDNVDLRVVFQTDRWSIFGFGRNVLDEKFFAGYVSSPWTGFDSDLASLGQPAIYGVEFRYEF